MADHVSASQFDTFFTCAEAYRRRYVCGDKIPPGIAAVAGTSFHKVTEASYNEILSGREHLSVKDCEELAAASYETELQKGIFLTREESQKKVFVLEEGQSKAIRGASLFREHVAEKFDPAKVEHRVEFSIEGVWKPVVGIIDLLTTDARIPDWKLSLVYNQSKADQSFAATVYWEAVRQEIGKPPKEVSFEVFKVRKTKSTHDHIVTQRDNSDVVTLANWSKIMESQMKAGNYPGCPPGHWKCSPKWCGYYGSCKLISDRLKRLPSV